jgi:hypothetical protein
VKFYPKCANRRCRTITSKSCGTKSTVIARLAAVVDGTDLPKELRNISLAEIETLLKKLEKMRLAVQ